LKITSRLVSWLAVLSPKAVTAEDMLDRFGPTSPVGRQFISWCYDHYQTYSTDGLVSESFEVWRGLYKEATNLDENAKIAIARFASNMGIIKPDAEKFLFAVETYIAVLMKLIVGEVSVQKNIAAALSLRGLLGTDMVEGYKELHRKLSVLRSLFEEDIFDWFLEPARTTKLAYVQAKMNLGDVVDALDNLDFSNIKTDLIRDLYHGFFDPDTRRALGEFYTKDEIVDEVLDFLKYDDKTVKKILSEDKILVDASCGSGTFLVRTIARWKNEISNVSSDPSKSTTLLRKITNNIIGIDIHPFAVTMARVNYLLAIADLLSPNIVNQIPEVVIPIYWTDSLVMREATVPRIDKGTNYRPVEIQIPILGKFVLPKPSDIDWEYLAVKVREGLDNKWTENRFLEEFPEDKRLAYRDLLIGLYNWFDEREKAGKDGRWISVLTNSIAVYKLQGKCSYVVGNPPWVRIHNIDRSIRDRIKKNFVFYRAGWNPNLLRTKARFKEQYDYCMAFVESGLRLLCDSGRLGFVITSKVMQSLYAGSMRKNLLENTKILHLKDYSLSEIQLFRNATNYPLILVFEKVKPNRNKIRIEVAVKGKSRSWELSQDELPVFKNDHMSPWMMAPPDAIRAFRKMQILEHEGGFSKNPRLGDLYEVARGVMTSANDIFLITRMQRAATPDLVVATNEGDENLLVEEELLCPLVRGKDISEFAFTPSSYIIWTHDGNGDVLNNLPTNAAQYFAREDKKTRLTNRDDYKKGMPLWTIFRVSKNKLEQKAAWHELSRKMEAVFLPRIYHDQVLGEKPLIVLQTVYFISSADEKFCPKMVLLLNSKPVRAFIKSFAERARGGYFRHISWTVGLIPLPKSFDELPSNLRNKSKIDEVISKAYGLTSEETKAINDYYNFIEKEVTSRK
jgi:hypothetical protein